MKWSRICHARRADQVSWTHTRSKIAVTKRANPSADLTELRQQLKAERLEEHIKQVVDSAPPRVRRSRQVRRPSLYPSLECVPLREASDPAAAWKACRGTQVQG